MKKILTVFIMIIVFQLVVFNLNIPDKIKQGNNFRNVDSQWTKDEASPRHPGRFERNFRDWPSSFSLPIDAAISGEGPYKGKAFFFKGDQYIQYDWDSDQVDPGYPKKIRGSWQGFPQEFTWRIDAAMNGKGVYRGKAFFFKGDRYIQYDWRNERVDPGFPKPIAGNWQGLPPEFTADIDAVIDGEGQYENKAYFFKGNRYVRYDWGRNLADRKYPKKISSSWWGFTPEFSQGVDAILNGYGPSRGKAFFFSGTQYIRYDWAKDNTDPGYPRGIRDERFRDDHSRDDRTRDDYEETPQTYDTPGNNTWGEEGIAPGKVYFFRGNHYVRYDLNHDRVDPGYPKRIMENWNGLPARFTPPIDAMVVADDSFRGKAYFFKDNQYLRFDMLQKRTDPGFPKSISGNWDGWPPEFTQRIDAAVTGEGASRGKAFFFKGDRYIRHDWSHDRVDPGFPRPIFGNWNGWPYEFTQGIDAALSGGGEFKGKAYFFKGDRYIRYDWERNRVDPGYPKRIEGNWYGFPDSFNNGIDTALEGDLPF
jgi:hypothetical protein